MTIVNTYEEISYHGPAGARLRGFHREVISGQGATRTLLAKESGALCLFDRAAGIVYTLPPPVAGMQFEFIATVAVTTNAYKVITDAATTFLVGGALAGELAAAMDYFQADGTTIVSVSAAGSTTGGLVGENYRFTAISATVWAVSGIQVGSGTLATAFATS